ncbi:FAD-binding oxidoreductase [Acidiferrimicrobium sp. IK]|uniref:FAD-binding oxidoreductase n=1 Tax=Acidiferrimicrobium sp. IK TaxID=2871700 RepID=UPI0021CAF09E|nr:FAD-binding oxidoreductase [Acidiferrimicrobium sp. IK]MCU4184077.1 FAD-binding oxidoreductase [Acidiferrimicrobium sp. IK]
MTTPTSPPPLGPGVPTPAVAFEGDPAGLATRFAGGPLPAGVARRLEEVCATVTTDGETCTESARDWWPLSVVWAKAGTAPARAGAVARPGSAGEVAAVLAVCNDAQVPVTVAAGRSGVCGASVPVFGGVVLDLTGLSGIEAYDDISLLVDVSPGTFGDRFEAALRDDHGATSGHWPQSMALSTVGGWLACRSAGQYSTRYGKIEDMVAGLQVAMADGTVIRTGGRAPRAATGPDLTQLFVGSEGTLGVITSARLKVRPLPDAERRAAWGFATVDDGLDACRRILRRGATPAVLRLYDRVESGRNFERPDHCVLIALDEGDPAEIDGGWLVVDDECRRAEPLGEGLVERWLAHRNQVADLGQLAAAGIVADTIEVAASWSGLTAIYHAALRAVQDLPATLAVSAHQSHAYRDGACLYFTFAGRPDPEGAEAYYRAAWDAVVGATLERGGGLSHHHGIGINRGRHMAAALDGGLQVLTALKTALDPRGILNPGKLGLGSPWGPPPW